MRALSLLNRARQFWNETVTEVWVKAIWPTPKELAQSTLVVVVSIAILSVCVFIFDFSMHELVRFVTHLVTQ